MSNRQNQSYTTFRNRHNNRKKPSCLEMICPCFASSHSRIAPLHIQYNSPMVQSSPSPYRRRVNTQIHGQFVPQPFMMQSNHFMNRNPPQMITPVNMPAPVLKVENTISENSLKVLSKKPTNQNRGFRYLCPICFRYFNHIYEFDCCQNYICSHCVKDINSTMEKRCEETALCCFCRKEDPTVVRVLHDAKSRKYEDSPSKMNDHDRILKQTNKLHKYAHTEIKNPDQVDSEVQDQSLLQEDSLPNQFRLGNLVRTMNVSRGNGAPNRLAYSINQVGINRSNTGQSIF